MKILSGILLLVLMAITATAQNAVQGQAPKVIAEIAASSEKAVKGAPFSAEAVSESVQILSDGNRIVRRWSDKLYRNSEGRFRREGSIQSGSGVFGTYYSTEPSVTILDPAGSRYYVDQNSKTVRSMTVVTPALIAPPHVEGMQVTPVPIERPTAIAVERLRADLEKLRVEKEKLDAEHEVARAEGLKALVVERAAAATAAQTAIARTPLPSKYESKTESLGVQNVEGVDADGVRTTTTIPAGAIGNERPIEIVYERWYSKELQIVVASRHYDPRFGEQTYRLTNINRSEPDPSLFEVPAGYKVLTEPGNTFRLMPAPRPVVEVTTQVKPTAAKSGTKP